MTFKMFILREFPNDVVARAILKCFTPALNATSADFKSKTDKKNSKFIDAVYFNNF